MRRIIAVLVMALLFTLSSNAQGARIKVLHSFGSTGDGSIPYGAPLLDSKGNVYGVTTDGACELGKSGWIEC